MTAFTPALIVRILRAINTHKLSGVETGFRIGKYRAIGTCSQVRRGAFRYPATSVASSSGRTPLKHPIEEALTLEIFACHKPHLECGLTSDRNIRIEDVQSPYIAPLLRVSKGADIASMREHRRKRRDRPQ